MTRRTQNNVINFPAPKRRSAIAASLADAKYAQRKGRTIGEMAAAQERKINARLRKFARDPDGCDHKGRAWEDV